MQVIHLICIFYLLSGKRGFVNYYVRKTASSSRNTFVFKQFEVDQSNCAMKINTDGVLLAAMVASKNPKHILDVGTGTGVIALMLAQRFENAAVVAIEIDQAASATAERNFQRSIFHQRLTVSHVAVEEFKSAIKFDLIVSNPPFFVNDLKNQEEKKGLARHTDEVFFDELVAKVNVLLSDQGSFWLILPVKQTLLVIEKAARFGMKVAQSIHVHSDETRPEFRRIICLKRDVQSAVEEHFYIYQSEKVYTSDYKQLLKDFFLAY